MIIRSFLFLFEVLMCVSSPTMLCWSASNLGWNKKSKNSNTRPDLIIGSRSRVASKPRLSPRDTWVLRVGTEVGAVVSCFWRFSDFSHFHFTLTSKKISIILHYLSASPTYFLICFLGLTFILFCLFFQLLFCLKKHHENFFHYEKQLRILNFISFQFLSYFFFVRCEFHSH